MSPRATPAHERLRIDEYVAENGMLASMAEEIKEALTSEHKRLSPKYFYDDIGSELFEQITGLPEYYPSRAERDLLDEVAEDVMTTVRPQQIVELGSGSSAKTRVLLAVESAPEYLETYVPFDVSRSIVEEAAAGLLEDFPYLRVHGVIGDFGLHLQHVPPANGPRLVLFLGGTIGNLDHEDRVAFLRQVRSLLNGDDRLLMGVDLVKDVETIEAAYNDSEGITAAFNRNMLSVINRGLGADFRPEAFEHRAFFNEDESRIEMHLVPRAPQIVTISDLDMTLTVAPPETIWTECSYKFTEASTNQMLTEAGLALDRFYTTDERLFGLVLAKAAK